MWHKDVVIGELDDIRDIYIGDALNPQPLNERGTATYPLTQGTNIDAQGVVTPVWFFLHDVSDAKLAEELGLLWAGRLQNVPVAATAEASIGEDGHWTFYGDLPNPVWANPPTRASEGGPNPDAIPDVDPNNTYSPLRRVIYNGQEVVFNAVIVKWGDEPWEHNRIDQSCVSFPDEPANTTCPYNGDEWGWSDKSGHVVALDTTGPNPSVTFKLHKSHAGEGDYVPYYIVLDTWPPGPARAMGVPAVPKHQFLADAAVPLIQFLPGSPIRASYPLTETDGYGLFGGGPFGGQIGIPSYFMPEDDYSPMWHIGFAHWTEPATEVVKGLKRVQELRAEGRLEVRELPPVRHGANDYDFDSLTPVHVVNCPIAITLDRAIHQARQLVQ